MKKEDLKKAVDQDVTDVDSVLKTIGCEDSSEIFKGAVFHLMNCNTSFAPKVFEVNIYNGDRYLEQRNREADLKRVQEYKPKERRLNMLLKDVAITDACLALLETVISPIDLAMVAIDIVKLGGLPEEWLKKEDYLQRLIDLLGDRALTKGMTVENVRIHIRHLEQLR